MKCNHIPDDSIHAENQNSSFGIIWFLFIFIMTCGFATSVFLGFQYMSEQQQIQQAEQIKQLQKSPLLVPEQLRVKVPKASGLAQPINYLASLQRVIDGDTIQLYVLIWGGINKQDSLIWIARVRLLGVDTPELHPRNVTGAAKERIKAEAKRSMEFTRNVLESAPTIWLFTAGKRDSFGRVLGEIIYLEQEGLQVKKLSEELLRMGLAKKWEK